MNCLGIPVRYEPTMEHLCDSRGIFFPEIVVGPAFMQLGERQGQAVLLHEVGHCKLRHALKRLIAVLSSPLATWLYSRSMLRVARAYFRRMESPEAQRMIQQELIAINKRIPHLRELTFNQEYQADFYAAQCGYGGDLVYLFSKMTEPAGGLHPSHESRIARLLACSKG